MFFVDKIEIENASMFGGEVVVRNATRNGGRVPPVGTHVAARAFKGVDSLCGEVGAPPAGQGLECGR